MKILIVEDETVAYENLIDILGEIDPGIEIAGITESISQTVHWLRTNPPPDLILMDIHLSDGSAFSIFDSIEVETAIIFTTAYDEYAIEAFKVNSIDYLLKPIKINELDRALQKLGKWKRKEVREYLARMAQASSQLHYKDRILVPVKDMLLPVHFNNIACFYTSDKHTKIYLKNGTYYPFVKTLEQISLHLNPAQFFRANKQFLIARDSVQNITIWFDNRLLINLCTETPEKIFISKNKASEFKAWIVNDG